VIVAAQTSTDFYTLAGTVVPILGLAIIIEARQPVLVNLISQKMAVAYTVFPFFAGGLSAWAEYDCLRALETGHPPFGGAIIVWIDLGILTLLIVLKEALRGMDYIKRNRAPETTADEPAGDQADGNGGGDPKALAG
jgi:hypothetical protein